MANFVNILSFIVCFSIFAVLAEGTTRIVGGSEAPPKFGRFHASLQNVKGLHVCGGAIVSKWHIVTAAHCVHDAKSEQITAIVGTIDLSKGGMKHNIESITTCRQYNFTERTNDIALLRVSSPFDLDHVSIISMDEEVLVEHDIVLLSGFGAQQVNASVENSMKLLMAPVFSQETCIYAMRYTRKVTNTMFCTFSKKGQGTCNGDSGSPILRGSAMVGLVSWGIPCAVGFPDVHTRIAPYLDWLKEEIHNDICGFKSKKTYNISKLIK